ncbi:MAG: hypothetical protein ACK5KL_20180 [Dysgonomonas sp.]
MLYTKISPFELKDVAPEGILFTLNVVPASSPQYLPLTSPNGPLSKVLSTRWRN